MPLNARCLDLDLRDTETGSLVPAVQNQDYEYNGHMLDLGAFDGTTDNTAAHPETDNTATAKYWDVALTNVNSTFKFALNADGTLQMTEDQAYAFMNGVCYKWEGRLYLEDAVHRGRVNTAFIDGHVETKWIKGIVMGGFNQPYDNPEWSRVPD